MRWVEHVAHTGEMRNVHIIFTTTSEGQRPLGRPRHMVEDNIEMDLKEKGRTLFCGVGWLISLTFLLDEYR
jgi:hypothetical protein